MEQLLKYMIVLTTVVIVRGQVNYKTNSTEDCMKCIDDGLVWCPDDDNYLQG